MQNKDNWPFALVPLTCNLQHQPTNYYKSFFGFVFLLLLYSEQIDSITLPKEL